MKTTLSEEEIDALLYNAREGDVPFIKEMFATFVSPDALPGILDPITKNSMVHMAAGNGHLELVAYLLTLVKEPKNFVNLQNDSGNTALHWAAYNGHLPVVEVLVEKGADVFLKNSCGHDSMYEAHANSQEEVENWMLKRFAIEDEVNIEDHGEDTKITYTPGTESKELEEAAAKAAQDMEKMTV